ncbi:hypothetical protein GGX14DRAFT_409058 [Mycena pura]|uniref:Helicase C-terminal domain-containing protein n=1 Tax=Mycena pura TaxID=153505 RepID=A0AAD6UJX4_9AGAR|nr:hypothetical protein GGX14DRAFT_409058 [Mycena pura]
MDPVGPEARALGLCRARLGLGPGLGVFTSPSPPKPGPDPGWARAAGPDGPLPMTYNDSELQNDLETSQAAARRNLGNKLIRDDPLCQVVIATIAFGQGFNVKTLLDSVMLGVPKTVAQALQQGGRVARDPSTSGRAVILAQSSAYTAAEKFLKSLWLNQVEGAGGKNESDNYEQREGASPHCKGVPQCVL